MSETADQVKIAVTYYFTSFDQSSRRSSNQCQDFNTRFFTFNKGAGRSDVRVQVVDLSPRGRTPADEIGVDAKCGFTPGMAESMRADALAGHVVAPTLVSGGMQMADEPLGTSVVADSDRATKGVPKQLAAFFGEQGWTD